MTTCRERECANEAAFRLTWPGDPDLLICAEHAPELGATLAPFGVGVEPIPAPAVKQTNLVGPAIAMAEAFGVPAPSMKASPEVLADLRASANAKRTSEGPHCYSTHSGECLANPRCSGVCKHVPVAVRSQLVERSNEARCTCADARANGADLQIGCPVHDETTIENRRRERVVAEQRTQEAPTHCPTCKCSKGPVR